MYVPLENVQVHPSLVKYLSSASHLPHLFKDPPSSQESWWASVVLGDFFKVQLFDVEPGDIVHLPEEEQLALPKIFCISWYKYVPE